MSFLKNLLPMLLLLTATPACAQTQNLVTPSITQNGEIMRYAGTITPKGVADLTPFLKDGGTLVIQSGGGDEGAAVTLGNLILDKRIHITLDGYCLSACANVMLAAANGRIDGNGGAVIGFHWSSIAIVKTAKDAHLTMPPLIPGVSERLIKLYERAGVNPDLLILASDKVGIYVRPDATHAAEKSGWFSRYQFWLPTDDDLIPFANIPAGLTATGRRRDIILKEFLHMTAEGDMVPNPVAAPTK